MNIDPWHPNILSDGSIELTPGCDMQSIFRAQGDKIIGAHLTIYSRNQPGPYSKAQVVAVNETTIIVRPMD